ncbi:Spherulation-specific family 4-domain-containing protein [Mycena vulgaris]|nr:Spherulation-specific family 4-domain-containing protein [Mycena vulgaris]
MPWNGISTILIQLTLVRSIQALSVLLPLYVPHGTNCAAWSPAFATISAHPSMTFYTIISPISGPGSSIDSQPDADFISCVLRLRLSGTQTVLGWVDTISPSTGTVLGDIDTYAGWNNSYRPNGIFLVDVTPTASRVSTYQGYVSHATSMGFTFTVLDAGVATSSSYLDMVDFVNTYEGPYSSFDPSSLSGTLSKQSVTLKSAPSTGSYSGVISQLQSLGVKAVYITDAPDMGTPLPAQLDEFVDEVASVGGSVPSGSTTSPASGQAPFSPTGSTTSPASGPAPSSPTDSTTSPASGSAPSSPTISSGSPPSSAKRSSSPSTAVKESLTISSVSSSTSPPAGISNQTVSAGRGKPPVTAVVCGVLGALLLLSASLAMFLFMRMRRRRQMPGAPDNMNTALFTPETSQYPNPAPNATVIPFPLDYSNRDRPSDSVIASPPPRSTDVKSPMGEMSTVTGAEARAGAATEADTGNISLSTTRASYPSMMELSAAPTYVGDSESEVRRESMGPPPSYFPAGRDG